MTDNERDMARAEEEAREALKTTGGAYGAVQTRALGEIVLTLLGRVQKAEARVKRLADFADGFAGTVDTAELHFNNNGKGMQVPFHGDFSQAKALPSLRRELKWWRARAREALKDEP